MYKKNIRIIPRLDIKGPNLVKGIHLEGLKILGSPDQFSNYYYEPLGRRRRPVRWRHRRVQRLRGVLGRAARAAGFVLPRGQGVGSPAH